MKFNPILLNDINQLSNEIAIIFGNRSLVLLKGGDYKKAKKDAQQSIAYFPTAKVRTHFHEHLVKFFTN